MPIRKQEGYSTLELVIAIFFMGIMVFYSYQMLVRQKNMVVRVNQNVEATTILYDMRQLLKGDGCKENFQGLKVNERPGKILSLRAIKIKSDGTSIVENEFSVEPFISDNKNEENGYKSISHQENSLSKTGLRIKSYELSSLSNTGENTPKKPFLIVNFDRGKIKEEYPRKIQLYAEVKRNKILDCSLHPITNRGRAFRKLGGELYFEERYMNLGADQVIAPLNLKGGIFTSAPEEKCKRRLVGTLFYEKKEKVWKVCTKKGLRSLTEMRDFK